jgi:hypothetical protein
MCLQQNLERRTRELETSKIASSRNRLDVNRYQLIWMRYQNRLFYDVSRRRQWTMFEWRQRKYVGLYKKRKIRVQVIIKLGNFLLFQEL